jgi:hypothetical protein
VMDAPIAIMNSSELIARPAQNSLVPEMPT